MAKCTNDTCKNTVIQKYLTLSDKQQASLENVCITNYNASQCENLRQQYFSYSETLTQINPNKLGGMGYWVHIEQENEEAESTWSNIARSNPNTSIVNQFGWMVHDNGGFGSGRTGTVAGNGGYRVGVNRKQSKAGSQSTQSNQQKQASNSNTTDRQTNQNDVISHLDNQKQSVNSANVGEIVRTPTTHPEDFTKKGKNYTNIHTGEIWQKSNTQHNDKSGEWKVGLNIKGKKSEPTPTKKITIGDSDGKIIKIENK